MLFSSFKKVAALDFSNISSFLHAVSPVFSTIEKMPLSADVSGILIYTSKIIA